MLSSVKTAQGAWTRLGNHQHHQHLQLSRPLHRLQRFGPITSAPSKPSNKMRGATTTSALATLWTVATVAGTGLLGILAWIDAAFKTMIPALQMAKTAFNQKIVDGCPTLHKPYKPLPFLTNGHVETIFAAKTRTSPKLVYRRELINRDDGGVVALDWEDFPASGDEDLPEDAPVLILLPGLTGGSGDSYVVHAVKSARQHGIRAVVFNGRGTADSPVLTPQFYSASYTGDMRAVVEHVRTIRPQSTLLAAGWSLGANIMVRYLGEEGERTPITAAVSMCNPFELSISNANFEVGFNRVYDVNLANALKRIFAKHEPVWRDVGGKFKPHLVPTAKTIREFDDYITIHTYGWNSVDEYYAGSSSSLSVPSVKIPLLCIQALDDPIAPKEAIPYDALAANPNCILVTTTCGGHLGWVAGPGAPFGRPWSDDVTNEFFLGVLADLKGRGEEARDLQASSSSSESLITEPMMANTQ